MAGKPGDNVSEGGYEMTFFKEGMAQLAQYMQAARNAAIAAGGLDTPAGQAAFQASLIAQFNTNYARSGSFWSAAPSNPTPYGLFSGSATYQRPRHGLHRALADPRHRQVHQGTAIQQTYGGGSITEPQLEAAYLSGLPNKSAGCQSLLSQFFTELVRHRLPQRYRHRAGHHRTWPGRARLLRHARR